MSFTSSCHCGAVSAIVDEDLPTKGMTCNCSICRRNGAIHHFTTPDTVSFVRPDGQVGEYTFNHHVIRYQFCTTCGSAPFAEGTAPGGKAMVEINLRCVPDCDLDSLEITEFDGASR
jgi:hypothetical protein